MTKCLDCGNTSRFISTYLDSTMTVYNEHGDVVDQYSVGYKLADEPTICGVCNSKNLSEQ